MKVSASTGAWVTAAAIACGGGFASGQEPAAAPPKPGCNGEMHRQFDFWVGDWVVTAGGKPAGENRIESILAGCALLENWSGAGGMRGKSLNFYDDPRGVWHQTWISDRGNALMLDGKFEGGRMTMTGEQVDPATKAITRQRIVWTPLPNGDVRQYWDSSTDGKTWTVQFDGLYQRKP